MSSLRERKPEQQQAPPIEAPPQTDRQTLLARAATESPEARKQTLEPPGTVSRDTGNGATAEPADPYKVTRGQVTFDAEGEETATQTSRDLEVPSDNSGVTIGRGYDMKERDADEIFRDMINAGVSEAIANKLKKASGLSGDTARAFIAKAENKDIVLDAEQQRKLFYIYFDRKVAYAADRVRDWTDTDLLAADPVIQDMIVDLFVRGDMTKSKWATLNMAEIVKKNDAAALRAVLADDSNWSGIDDTNNRYWARLEHVDDNDPGLRRATTRDGLMRRSEPKKGDNIVGDLEKGKTVTVLKDAGDWRQVTYRGDTFFLHGDYLDEKPAVKDDKAARAE